MKSPLSPSSLLLFCPLLFLVPAAALADVKLPALISDNMVLLQDTPANVWGTADPGEQITVKLADKASAQSVADANGHWSVKLSGLTAGEAGEMTISGHNSITVKNVAVGEVWVCSGQSNMEMIVQNSANAPEEIAAANHPQIRVFTVQRTAKAEPQADCAGKWEVCSPATAGRFTAVGYYFGRHLLENLKVPIGLIHSSWGGTGAELWTPTDVLAKYQAFKGLFTAWEQTKERYPQAKAEYDAKLATWQEAAKKAKDEGTRPAPVPRPPHGGDDFGSPGCLYNAMISPLLPYTIRGTIWYQGEANTGNAALYENLFPLMIQTWRERWGAGEFPFLYVQLANFMKRYDEPTDSNWAALRDAQLKTLDLPHTGMAVTIDIGDATTVHPTNKQEVGRRLGLVARAAVYYQDVEYSGPMPGGAQEEDGKIRLTLRFSEGMKSKDGGKLTGFAIAGDDHKFHWAEAEIQGDHVIVSSPDVPKPVAVRYDWADNPDGNLINETNLPASPFRTDDWPQNPPRPER